MVQIQDVALYFKDKEMVNHAYDDPSYLSNLPEGEPSLVNPDVSELEGVEIQEPATLENLIIHSEKRAAAIKEIGTYTSLIAELNKEVIKIEEQIVPQIMDQLNMEDFKLKDGTKIKIDLKFQGSVVKEDPQQRKKQLEFLVNNGAGDLIKRTFTLDFKKGKEKEAEAFRKLLKELEFDYTEDESVHASSLGSTIKAMVVKAKKVPFEELKWRVFKRATFKEPTVKKDK